MTPFRWKNCYADVAAARHDMTIQSFLDDVILPAIRALEDRIASQSCIKVATLQLLDSGRARGLHFGPIICYRCG